MFRRALPGLGAALALRAGGCGGEDRTGGDDDAGTAGDAGADAGAPPPERCATFEDAGPRFRDVTDAWGIGASGLDGDTDRIASAYGRQWNQLRIRGEEGHADVGESSGFAGEANLDYEDNEFYRCFCRTTGSCTAPTSRISCDGIYWNEGVDDQPFRLNGNTFTTACADVDADGDQDL